MAIDKGDKVISHALKIDGFFSLEIFHSHAFETSVQCTISCLVFILKLMPFSKIMPSPTRSNPYSNP